MKSSKVNNQIDLNDLQYVEERFGLAVSSHPCPQDKLTGKINPQVSTFKLLGEKREQTVSLFHVKPVYYEHAKSSDAEMVFRPMYEVCEHYGNHLVIFKYEELLNVHPRFLEWLKKRMKLINGQILVTSPFSSVPSPWSFVHETVHASIVRPTVGLTTTTVYPDPSPETTTVDGYVGHDAGSGSTWALIRGGAGTGAVDNVASFDYSPDVYSTSAPAFRSMHKNVYLFDTSTIPDGDTISDATLSLYGKTKYDPSSITPSTNITAIAPASNTALVAGDYDSFSDTAFATAVTYASFSTSAYNDYVFNASGISSISLTGVSKYSLRFTFDITNTAPTQTPADGPAYGFYYAETTGTTSDPKLAVVHSSPSVSVTVSAGVNTGTFSVPTYTAKTAVTLSPSTQSATFSVIVYAILSGVVVISASTFSATFSAIARTVTGVSQVAVSTLSATFSVITFFITGLGVVLTQNTLTATFTTAVLTRIGSAWTKVSRNASGIWTRSNRNND